MKHTSLSQFLGIAGTSALSLVLLGVFTIGSVYQLNEYNELNYLVDRTHYFLGKSRIAKEEFLGNSYTDTLFVVNGSNKSLMAFGQSSDSLQLTLRKIREYAIGRQELEIVELERAEEQVKAIKQDMVSLSGLIRSRGFKDLGLEGRMRAAIHFIEKADLPVDKVHLLTLRRHEKDFFLRKDLSYVKKFEKEYEAFSKQLAAIKTSNTELKEQVLSALNTYEAVFGQIVAIEQQIGLEPESGFRRELSHRYMVIENSLDILNGHIRQATRQASGFIRNTLTLLFVLLLTAGFMAGRWLLLSIAMPLEELKQMASRIARGELNLSFRENRSNSLLGVLTLSFQQITEKFKEVMLQVEGISSRQITQELPVENEKDQVTQTLNQVISQLRIHDQEEENRKWYSHTLTQFTNLLQSSQDKENIYDELMKQFVQSMKANQGALFLVEQGKDEEEYLELAACYAYGRKKHHKQQIQKGEGLAGAVWREQEMTYLTEVPASYVRITSGLGEALPRCVLIMPMIVNQQVMGVLELASFSPFKDHQVKLIKDISDNVAAFIQSNRSSKRNLELLENANRLAMQLQAQEEELLQNMEEMQSTQEEMHRVQSQLQDKIYKLEKENQHLGKWALEHGYVGPVML